jgi:hypothetical protein
MAPYLAQDDNCPVVLLFLSIPPPVARPIAARI